MRRRHLLQAGLSAAAAGALARPGIVRAQGIPGATWKPARPVTIIVPWAAGGSTDQCIRVVANELQTALGQSVVVVNQPGASGSIGTRNVLSAPHDGYTWASGAAVDLGCYKVLGLLDTMLADWDLFLAIANVSILAANPRSPYKDFGAFQEAMTKQGGAEVPVATAGISSAGQLMMEMVRAADHGTYRHVPYDGGNPAVIAAVAGETPVVGCLLVEAGDMIKAKRLIPLAALSDKPVPLDGFGDIPPVTKWLPSVAAPLNYFGMWVPKDVPAEVRDTMRAVWSEKIAHSTALADYAKRRAAIYTPLSGDEAAAEAMKLVRTTAWLYYDAGKARVSPDSVGLQRGAGPRMAAPGDAPPPTPRGDLYVALGFLVFGGAVVAASAAMPTFTDQGTPIYVAPGLVPGFHGVVIGLLALVLAARSLSRGALTPAGGMREPEARAALRRGVGRIALATALTLAFALGLIGHMPFWLAAAVFIFVFILAFEWRPGLPPRELARDAAWAGGIAVAAGWAATLLFERVFLIRLP